MKHLLILTFIIFSFSAFSQIDTTERKLPTRFRNDLPKPPKEKIYPAPKPDEEFTMFPGCDSIKNYTERRKCSDSLMLSFVYANICYPDSARENGIEGTVVISFIVEKDGSISNHRITRNPGGGLGEEALRIVKMFPKFIPTKFYWQDGEVTIIECPFNLPIKFRLE